MMRHNFNSWRPASRLYSSVNPILQLAERDRSKRCRLSQQLLTKMNGQRLILICVFRSGCLHWTICSVINALQCKPPFANVHTQGPLSLGVFCLLA